jgi:hypothetical protein
MKVMRTFFKRRTGTVALSLALIGHFGQARADDSTNSKGDGDGKGAPAVSQLANGGFALDFEVWQPAGHGKPKGLTITYTWSGATRVVEASRQNDRWHAEFPTQPAAHEQATLLLRYSFELSDADKAAIARAESKIVAEIFEAIHDAVAIDIEAKTAADAANAQAAKAKAQAEQDVAVAAATLSQATAGLAAAKQSSDADAIDRAARAQAQAELADLNARTRLAAATKALETPAVAPVKFASTFASASKAIAASDAAKTLRQYGSKDQDGMALLLDKLGIAEGQSGWELVADDKALLAQQASSWVQTDGEIYTPDIDQTVKELAAAKPQPGCALDPKSKPGELSDGEAKALLAACVAVHRQQPAGQQAPLSASLSGLLTDTGEDRAMDAEDVLESSLGQSYAAIAVRLAERTLYRSEKRSQRAALLALLVNGLDTAFAEGGRNEDGATLVKGAAKPRRYDVATGVVYVHRLEDVIVPSLIAVCGWEGCLDTNEVPWTAKNGWYRAFSLDAGIRMKTLGTQDRRQSDTLSFLVGASFNPISVLRVSGGMYAFENAQKKSDGTMPWQLVPYVGATLNVLNAAAVLGSLGLNQDLSPTASPVETSAK